VKFRLAVVSSHKYYPPHGSRSTSGNNRAGGNTSAAGAHASPTCPRWILTQQCRIKNKQFGLLREELVKGERKKFGQRSLGVDGLVWGILITEKSDRLSFGTACCLDGHAYSSCRGAIVGVPFLSK